MPRGMFFFGTRRSRSCWHSSIKALKAASARASTWWKKRKKKEKKETKNSSTWNMKVETPDQEKLKLKKWDMDIKFCIRSLHHQSVESGISARVNLTEKKKYQTRNMKIGTPDQKTKKCMLWRFYQKRGDSSGSTRSAFVVWVVRMKNSKKQKNKKHEHIVWH